MKHKPGRYVNNYLNQINKQINKQTNKTNTQAYAHFTFKIYCPLRNQITYCSFKKKKEKHRLLYLRNKIAHAAPLRNKI